MRRTAWIVVLIMVGTFGTAMAQPVGTFRWQQQPYCNVLTLNVVQAGGVYHLDGYDDQCGAQTLASVVGMAFPNPNGTIGMGLTVVTTPGATPLHLDATLALPAVGGPWRDSAGGTGAFVLVNGPAASGSPRPVPRLAFPGGLSAGGTTITNVATPATASDAATKGYTDAVAGAKANVGDLNLVVPVAGSGFAGTLPAVNLTMASSSFTTPRAGHLLVSADVGASLVCNTDGTSLYWLIVDGVPVRSSVRATGFATGGFSSARAIHVEGYTATSIAAGNHTMAVQAGCQSGTFGGWTSLSSYSARVTVLDSGFGGRLAAAVAERPVAACNESTLGTQVTRVCP